MTVRLVLTVLAFAMVLAGCISTEPEFTEGEQVPESERPVAGEDGDADDGADDGTVATLTFVAVDIDYSEAPDTAPAGNLAIEIINEGAIVHNVVFEGVRDDEVIAEAEGGESAVGEVELEAGSYTYYCSIPGHREAGMEGELAVE